ncbi:MAG: hypothetical protein CMG60_07400 [Candidatus Marinimicrobia bacterium]|nr:hypothetical protein [Candidatus Neomarinimicrobiota bacterium]|tara:strand:+ start:809 stop:1177 length:369 start_codon:yes stop_codon:yes gene_type:complete
MIKRINRTTFFINLIVALIFIEGCTHNYEPVISDIIAVPNPVESGEIVNLECKASDDDESSMMKQEALSYSWSSAYGDVISNNQDQYAIWEAPLESGMYSITCTVSDEFNGMDILTIDIIVQ